jgi:hypothetical protein
MLRRMSFQVVCALTVLCLLAPAVSYSQESGQAPSLAQSNVQAALPPAGGLQVCPAASPKVAQPLQGVRWVTNCTAFACTAATNCTKLCGDVAFCDRQIGQPNGFCDFR